MDPALKRSRESNTNTSNISSQPLSQQLPGGRFNLGENKSTRSIATLHQGAVSKRRFSSFLRLSPVALGGASLLLFVIIGGILLLLGLGRESQQAIKTPAEIKKAYSTAQVSLKDARSDSGIELSISDSNQELAVNGQLRVNNTLILTPTGQPQTPSTGQIYYSQTANQPYYFDGTRFVAFASESDIDAAVRSLNLGAFSRLTGVGNGLAVQGQTLENTGVLSLQGQTGNVTLSGGDGIGISGTTITNTGVTGIIGTANQVSVSSSTGEVIVSLPQDIAPSSSPTFASLTADSLIARPSATILTIGSSDKTLELQGSSTTLSQTSGGFTSTLAFNAPSADQTITLPDESGTICLQGSTNCGFLPSSSPAFFQNGNSFGTLATLGTNDTNALAFETSGVERARISATGDVGIGTMGPGYKLDVAGDVNTTTLYRVGGVPISSANLSNDANLAKLSSNQTFTGINSFTNAGNSFVGDGMGLTNLNADNITTGILGVAQGGTGVNGTLAANGQLLIGNGSGFSLATLTAGAGITITNSAGGIQLDVVGAGSCATCANVSLSNLNNVAINTSLLTGGDSIDLGSGVNPFRDLYLGGTTTNNIRVTGTASSPRTITLPDASGTVAVSASGNIALDVSGNISFTGQLPIANGGTNSTANPIAGGLAYGTGTAYAFTSFGVLGQVVTSGGAGSPSFQNLASLLVAGSNVAITGATTPSIAVVASPIFTNVTATGSVSIQGPNSLELGSNTNVGSIIFRDGATANTGTLQLAGALSGNTTYTLPVGTGTQNVCTVESGNCAGSGTGITGSGTTNRIAKFTAGQAVGDSNISDDGTSVVISTGATIQGSSGLTLGTTGVTGQLVFKNSTNANTLTLQSGASSGNLTFTLPTSDGSANDCLKTNGSGGWTFAACTGGPGGGVTSVNTQSGVVTIAGTANQINVVSGGGTITLSTPQDIATTSDVNFHTLGLSGANANVLVNASTGASANLIDLQVNGSSQFAVAPNGNVTTTGTINGQSITVAGITSTGYVNAGGGALQTAGTDRITNAGNIVNVGTITTSGLINGQNISSAAVFSGTLAVTTLGVPDSVIALCRNGSNQIANCATSGNGAAFVQGGNSFGATAVLGTNDNNALQIRTNGATAMTVLANGNVGIGQTNPGTKLDVTAPNSVGIQVLSQSASAYTGFGIGRTALEGYWGIAGNPSDFISGSVAGDTAIRAQGNLLISSGGNVPRIYVQSTGNVGIGTTSPDSLLNLQGATPALQFGATSASDEVGLKYVAGDTEPLQFQLNGITRFGMRSNGFLQIDGPGIFLQDNEIRFTGDSKLQRNFSTGEIAFTLQNAVNANFAVLLGGSSAKSIVRAPAVHSGNLQEWQNSSGGVLASVSDTGGGYFADRVGIGVPTPGYPLDVAGDINTSGVYRINGNAICTASGCTAAAGSGNYIQNGTGLQVANFNIQSASAGSVGGIIRGATSQTADLQQWQNSAGDVLAGVNSIGQLRVSNGGGYASPGLTFGTDSGTGLLGSTSNGLIGMAVGGVERFRMSAGVTRFTNDVAGAPAFIVRGAASQTADMFQLQNSSGTTLLSVTAGGNLNLAATSATGGQITQAGTRLIHTTGGVTNFYAGFEAGNLTMTGVNDTGIGFRALRANTSGNTNSAFGYQALTNNTTGTSNTATGADALSANISGISNVANGQAALLFNTTGSSNVAVGTGAGLTSVSANGNVSGSNNTFIGHYAGPGTTTQLQSAAAIGTNAVVSQSNSLVLGCINGVNGCTADTKVGIGTAAPGVKLEVSGTSGAGNFEALRLTNLGQGLGTEASLDFALGAANQIYGEIGVVATGGNQGALLFKTSDGGSPVERMRVDRLGNVGIGTTSPTDAKLQFATGTTEAGGIAFGTGVNRANLYQSAADTLKTDDSLVVGNGLTVSGTTSLQGHSFFNSGAADQVAKYSGTAGFIFGSASDTNLYRSAADTLKTDDSLIVGTIGTGGTNLLCYDGTNKLATCSGAPGAGSYINNSTSLQTAANFNIQSAAAGSVGGIIRGATSQTADLLQLQNSGGTNLLRVDSGGNIIGTGYLRLNTTSASSIGGSTIFDGGLALSVNGYNAGASVMNIVGATSQSGDLLRFLNSGGTTLLGVTSGGNLNLAATSATGGQITQAGSRLIHTSGGTTNFFAGINAGNLTTTGLTNTGIGNNALLAVTTAQNNTALGNGALQNNSTGFANTAVGIQALTLNNGDYNTAVGRVALAANTSGGGNTALGVNAMLGNTTGSNNISVGGSTGAGNTTGSNNIFIGVNANIGTATQIQNATAIGTSATVSNSNALSLGCVGGTTGCSTNSVNVGIGVADVQSRLQVQSDRITGTGTITTVGTAVTGSGTSFTTQAKVGDTIIAAAQARRITAIGSNTSLTIESAFSSDLSVATNFIFTTPVQTISSSGAALFRNSVDSTTAFQIQNAAAQTLLVADTTNQRLSIGPAAVPATSVLTVGTNTTAASGGLTFGSDTNLYRSAADTLKTDDAFSAAAITSTGSITANNQLSVANGAGISRYLQITGTVGSNTELLVTGASAKSVPSVIFKAGVGQTTDLLQLQNNAGTILTAFQADGKLVFGPSGAQDTNLYRSAADTLKTDDSLIVGTIGAGGTNLLCYDGTNKLTTCSGAPGAGSYINNGTALQTANFNIQSVAAGNIGGIIRGAASQTADLFQLQDSTGAVLSKFDSAGGLTTTSLNVSGTSTLASLSVTGLTTTGSLSVTGTATFNGDIAFSANTRGKDEAITLAANTLVISGKTYPDASYSVLCTPNYDTTCFVTNKTATGFTLNFGAAAPASSTVDWIVIR